MSRSKLPTPHEDLLVMVQKVRTVDTVDCNLYSAAERNVLFPCQNKVLMS